jgi:hypothetical protein
MTKNSTPPDDYETAHKIGLDCLDRLAESGVNLARGLATLLTVVSHATYAMAPNDNAAEGVIKFAANAAGEDWASEKLRRAER